MDQNEFDIISIVSTRKTEFYMNARTMLLTTLPVSIDRDQTRSQLRRVISQLDNSLFISEDERMTRTLDPGRSISKLTLDTDEIQAQIVRRMSAI